MALTLQNLIKTYNYEEITTNQLAELAGFNDKQKQLVNIFWDAAFNQSWLYLSDYLILNHLTNETGKDAISHYYKQILKKYCIENEDYKEIKRNNEVVVKFDSLNLANQKDRSKQGAKRYYAITGECFSSGEAENFFDRAFKI